MSGGKHKQKSGTVRIIGAFKLVKGLLLLAVGFGALKFLHRDLAQTVQEWLQHWQIDPGKHYLVTLTSKLTHLDSNNVALLSAATLFYAVLFLIEGVGLLLMKRWAEIFTVIITGSFIPLEIYHLVRHFSAMKIVMIIVNAAIVAYLIWRLKKEPKSH